MTTFATGDTVEITFGGETFQGVARNPTRLIPKPAWWLVDFIHEGEPLTLAYHAEDMKKVETT